LTVWCCQPRKCPVLVASSPVTGVALVRVAAISAVLDAVSALLIGDAGNIARLLVGHGLLGGLLVGGLVVSGDRQATRLVLGGRRVPRADRRRRAGRAVPAVRAGGCGRLAGVAAVT